MPDKDGFIDHEVFEDGFATAERGGHRAVPALYRDGLEADWLTGYDTAEQPVDFGEDDPLAKYDKPEESGN